MTDCDDPGAGEAAPDWSDLPLTPLPEAAGPDVAPAPERHGALDLHLLPKVRDSWSYLYVEHGRIDQAAKAIAVHDAAGRCRCRARR